MSKPRRPNDRFQDRFPIPVDIASKTANFTQKLLVCAQPGLLEVVHYDNVTGLAADPTNYFDIEIKNAAVSMAKWSTLTGAQGALPVDTFVTIPLSASIYFAAGDVLSLALTLHGTQTLPVGRLVAHVRYF